MRAVVVSLFAGLTVSALATSAGAQTDIDQIPVTPPPLAAVGAAEFALHDAPTSLRIDVDALSDSLALQQGGSPRTVAVEYSDAYAVRRKIATRNMDRLAIRRQGMQVIVGLDRLLKSDQNAAEWAAAVVTL